MAEIDPVILRLIADDNQYRAQLRATTSLVDSSLNRQERSVQRLEREWRRSGGLISGSIRAIGTAAASFVTIDLARRFLATADSAKQIDAQLRLATQSFGSFTQAQADSERIAAATRNGLVETTALYGNFVRATEQLGGSQDEAARATETFSKALKIGGAGTQEAASATLQFGQALASGVLRGDEFNSIAEASPRILRLLSDALGVSRGELRGLAADGKLTSDVLFSALTDRRFTSGIDEEFRTLPVTFSEAMQQVENAAILTFGAFDRGGQFSEALATFVKDGSEGFESLGDDAERLGITIRSALDTLGDAFDPLLEAGRSAFAALEQDGLGFTARLRRDIGESLRQFDQLNEFGARYLGTARTNWASSFQANIASRERESSSRRVQDQFGFRGPSGLRGYVNGTPAGARPRPAATGSSTKGRGGRGPSAETLAKREEAQRLREMRDDEAFANEKAALNQDVLRARAALVTATETIAQFELDEIEAQRKRQNDAYAADVKLGRLKQHQADELTALNDQVAQARQDVVERDRRERAARQTLDTATADLDNQRDLASIDADLAVTNAQRRDAALRLLDLELERERLSLEAINASEVATEAEKEIARRRLDLLPQIKAGRQEGIQRDNESPFQYYARSLRNQGENIDDEVESLIVKRLDEVDDAITDAISNRLGVKDPLLKQLLNLFIQQNLIGPIAEALAGNKGGGGFLGAVIGAGSSLFGRSTNGADKAASLFGRASGGYVAPGQTVRVNENRGGVELLRMGNQGGTVIPLGQANAARPASQTIVKQTFVLDARYGVTTPQLLERMNQMARDEAAAAGAASYQQSMKDAPNAVTQARRFGSSAF